MTWDMKEPPTITGKGQPETIWCLLWRLSDYRLTPSDFVF